MREVLTIIRADIRKDKATFFCILILICIIAMSITSVITIYENASVRDEQELNKDGFGDDYILFAEKTLQNKNVSITQLCDNVNNSSIVKKAELSDAIDIKITDLNGVASNTSILGQDYNTTKFNFEVFKDGDNSLFTNKPDLNQGEICVPVSFISNYNCKIGDQLLIKTDNEDKTFKIKYFFEDPFMGSSMIGMKTVLLNSQDYNELVQQSNENENSVITRTDILNVFKNDSYTDTSHNFIRELNEQTGVNDFSYSALSKSDSMKYTLTMMNIYCGLLIAFILLLLIISLIIIGHSISCNIEADYISIGIYKALGYTKEKIKICFMLRYLLACFIGCVLGVSFAKPVIKLITNVIRPSTGLYIPDNLAWTQCLLSILAIFVFITIYITITIRKVSKITPMQAISGETQATNKAIKYHTTIKKKGLNFWIALHQLTANKKQYIGTIIITMVMVFFLILITNMVLWLGGDGKNISRMYNCYSSDLEISYTKNEDGTVDDLRQKVENTINQYTQITNVYALTMRYLNFNNSKMLCVVTQDPEQITSIENGTSCLNEDEVVITQFVADDYGLKIGDTVNVSYQNHSKDFVVSGIYQNGADTGDNFAISFDGFNSMVGYTPSSVNYQYHIKDVQTKDKIINEIKKEYGQQVILATDVSSIKAVINAVREIAIVIYVIETLFIGVIAFLLCEKLMMKEKTDIGIFKAVGFTTKRLQRQFSLRFACVSAFGCLLGIILNIFLSQKCLLIIFSKIGIDNYTVAMPITYTIIPAIFVILIFSIFSYFFTKKIKKVEVRSLIIE